MALTLSVSILRKCSIGSFCLSKSLNISSYSTFLEVTFFMIGSHLMNMCSWSSTSLHPEFVAGTEGIGLIKSDASSKPMEVNLMFEMLKILEAKLI